METRPAGKPHLQTQNGPPLATKALKLANHQPIWPPAHGKTPWGLPTPIARHLVWPPNLAGWTLCTFHSSFPPRVPPGGAGTPCPGTKMAKPIKTLRHHIVGGQLGCGLGLWTTTWQVSGVRKKWENTIEKKNIGFGHKRPKNAENRKRAKMLRHQSVPAHGEAVLGKPTRPPATHEVRQPKCPVLGHFGPKHACPGHLHLSHICEKVTAYHLKGLAKQV